MKLVPVVTCVLLAGLAGQALAFHDGDNIYGAVGGQVRVVDPTNASTEPRTYVLSRVLAGGVVSYVADVGFDFWDLGQGIDEVSSATLNGRILSHGLKVRDNLRFFFASPGYYNQPTGSTLVRQSFNLTGPSRHKHFTFFVGNVGSPRTYDFEYWFTNGVSATGGSLTDSPRYRLRFVVNPTLSPVSNPAPVPEPATLVALGIGMGFLRRRK